LQGIYGFDIASFLSANSKWMGSVTDAPSSSYPSHRYHYDGAGKDGDKDNDDHDLGLPMGSSGIFSLGGVHQSDESWKRDYAVWPHGLFERFMTTNMQHIMMNNKTRFDDWIVVRIESFLSSSSSQATFRWDYVDRFVITNE
jgi:hypothetical protein